MARFRPKPLKTTERLVVVDSRDEESEDDDSFTIINNRRKSQADKHATRRTTRSLSHSDTNMFPEEESEKHLQQVIQKQDTEIPTPSFRLVSDYDADEDEFRRPWKCPRKYIEYTAKVPEEMIAKVAEYDLDEEDELFLSNLNFPQQILSKDQFEFMIDRFEAECIQDEEELPPFEEIERLFGNASPEMLQKVYDHWVSRRKISGGPLVAKLRPPSDPHRKHKPWRRNDAASYKKMWQLRQEMEHARTLIEMIRKREKLKRDLLVTRADIIMSNLPNFETDHELSSPEIGEKKLDDILLLEENFECVRNSIHERLKGR